MAEQPKSVFITGASAGIGAETALLAAREGWDIAIGYRSDQSGAELIASQVCDLGRQAILVRGDVGNPDEQASIWETVDKAFPMLGALVNNAGIVAPKTRTDDLTFQRVSRMFDVNTIGPMMLCSAAVKRMSTHHGGMGGVIVNVSSMAARLGSPGEYTDYAASKAALDAFTKGLSIEVADEGVRVNSVRPGTIDTGIHARGGQPDRAMRVAPLIPMKRAGTAQEIAQAVVWLLSDKSSYVTGAFLDVSGGR